MKFYASLAALAFAAISFGADLTGGLVISRVGDGSAALSSAATAVFIDKYSVGGTYDAANSIAMPTTTLGSVTRFTNSGSATSSLQLNLSGNGQFLVLGGLDAAVGATSVTGTTSINVNRIICRVALDGSVDTTTRLGDAYSGDNFRMVASTDGYQFWTAGNSSGAAATGGIRQTSLGSTTSTLVAATPNNTRTVNIYNGNLYMGSSSGAFLGVSQTGSGQPSGTGETNTLIAPTGTGSSAYDFLFTNDDTMFVADDRTSTSGGILKFTRSGGVWTLTETINIAGVSSGFVGTRSLTTDGNLLFAITTDNRLISINDADNSVLTLATGASNTAFRGVRYVPTQPVPEPATMVALGVGAIGLLSRRRRK